MPPRAVLFSLLAAVAIGAGACRRAPPPVVAMEPRPNPPLTRAQPPPEDPRERLRQNRWLAQFWEELTPSQRRRVEARMQRAKPPMAPNRESAAQVWDGLGLAERDRLVFGAATPAARGPGAQPAASAAASAAKGADSGAASTP